MGSKSVTLKKNKMKYIFLILLFFLQTPPLWSHTDQYREEVNAYMIRHYVQPGITGWAQVRGYRGETKELEAMQKRVEHDIVYVENWTFLMDLKIIFLTVWNVIRGEKNAY